MPSPESTSSQFPDAAGVIAALGLQPLDQEGGWFRRTAESTLWLRPEGESTPARRAYSVIYALFTPRDFSALHRLGCDEIWCWHAGDGLESLRLRSDGSGTWVRLGANLAAGERPQDIVPAGEWQGTRLAAGGRWALVSCIVAPEFRWSDFELGDRLRLGAAYPEWCDAIHGLTREEPPAGVK